MRPRPRHGLPLIEEQKRALVALLEGNSAVLFNKSQQPQHLRNKTEAWQHITRRFNELFPAREGFTPRTTYCLKRWWDNYKQKVKREQAERKLHWQETGEDAASPETGDPLYLAATPLLRAELLLGDSPMDSMPCPQSSSPRQAVAAPPPQLAAAAAAAACLSSVQGAPPPPPPPPLAAAAACMSFVQRTPPPPPPPPQLTAAAAAACLSSLLGTPPQLTAASAAYPSSMQGAHPPPPPSPPPMTAAPPVPECLPSVKEEPPQSPPSPSPPPSPPPPLASSPSPVPATSYVSHKTEPATQAGGCRLVSGQQQSSLQALLTGAPSSPSPSPLPPSPVPHSSEQTAQDECYKQISEQQSSLHALRLKYLRKEHDYQMEVLRAEKEYLELKKKHELEMALQRERFEIERHKQKMQHDRKLFILQKKVLLTQLRKNK